MHRLLTLVAVAAVCTAPAPPAHAGQQPVPQSSGEILVRLETPHGNIVIAVDTARAPMTAANFLRYVDAGLYDGGRFDRATREDNYTPNPPNRPMMNIIQGGIDPARNSERFDPIPLERTSVTGIKHVRGVVSMARRGPDSATSAFFILLDDQPSLDFGGLRFDDGQGGAAFGRVVQGLDVVEKIQQQPVQGQSLTPPVPITRAVRVARVRSVDVVFDTALGSFIVAVDAARAPRTADVFLLTVDLGHFNGGTMRMLASSAVLATARASDRVRVDSVTGPEETGLNPMRGAVALLPAPVDAPLSFAVFLSEPTVSDVGPERGGGDRSAITFGGVPGGLAVIEKIRAHLSDSGMDVVRIAGARRLGYVRKSSTDR